ncbi:MAG: hypothetical protein OEV95_04680 [Gemmatimonadota bacterium]|nr:hypothetical protein [Gemmatimonadota bacterium]
MRLAAVWRWHDDPRLVAFAATPVGRIVLWLAAVLLAAPEYRTWVAVVLPVVLARPARRNDCLALAALGVLYVRLGPTDLMAASPVRLAVMPAVLGLLYVVYLAVRRFRELPPAVRRSPLAALHVSMLGTLAVIMLVGRRLEANPGHPLLPVVLALETLVPFLLWRASYLVLSGRRGSVRTTRFRDHLGYLLPVWGGSQVPYGKGHDYLAERSVESAAALASVRLSGLKLLALAWVWTGGLVVFNAATRGIPAPGLEWLAELSPGIPSLRAAVSAGSSIPWLERWCAVGAGFLADILWLASWGHAIIGVLRLLGFRVFRNTYKPLLAPSVVEFWNRYYFYFKELLVEFFFYPTYLATSRLTPRVRIFLAVMASAALGNLYFHLVRDFDEFFLAGPDLLVSRLSGRMTYSLLLGLGVYVSMIREQGRRGHPAPAPGLSTSLRQWRARIGVWLFFATLHVWNVGFLHLTWGERWRFCLALIGL